MPSQTSFFLFQWHAVCFFRRNGSFRCGNTKRGLVSFPRLGLHYDNPEFVNTRWTYSDTFHIASLHWNPDFWKCLCIFPSARAAAWIEADYDRKQRLCETVWTCDVTRRTWHDMSQHKQTHFTNSVKQAMRVTGENDLEPRDKLLQSCVLTCWFWPRSSLVIVELMNIYQCRKTGVNSRVDLYCKWMGHFPKIIKKRNSAEGAWMPAKPKQTRSCPSKLALYLWTQFPWQKT